MLVRFSYFLACLLLVTIDLRVAGGQPASTSASLTATLKWQTLPELPNKLGVAGPFVGVHDDVLIVAGGANFPQQPYWENDKVWHADAWCMTREADGDLAWHMGKALDRAIAYGAAATTSLGVVCLGGDDGEQISDRSFLLTWNRNKHTIVQSPLPQLPEPCAYGAATAVGDVVYLASGQRGRTLDTATNNLWRLDLTQEEPHWEVLPPCPGTARAFNMTVAQHNGFDTCVYLFGGRRQKPDDPDLTGVEPLCDLYEFNPQLSRWRRRSDLPQPLMAGTAAAVGQSQLFALTGADGSLWLKANELKLDHPGFPKRMLAYHTITDTWVDAGATPANPVTTPVVRWGKQLIVASGEVQPGVRSNRVWAIAP